MLALEQYKQALPKFEFDALNAWASTFWPFQRAWLFDQSRRAFCNKARQIGISHSTAGILVMWGAMHGETTTVISIGQRESAEVLDKCRQHRDILIALGSKMAGKGSVNNATEITFASGGRIIALPSTAARGFTGNVYLDEFAYYERAPQVWDAAMAVTMLGFRSRISSTPNGVGNDFHRLVSDVEVRRGWTAHEIPIQRAIADGYPVNMEDCWVMAKQDPRIFDQLFNCSFLDSEFQYIPSEMLDLCSVETLPALTGRTYAGLDIGKSADKTVLTIVQRNGPTKSLVYMESCKRTDFSGLHEMVARAFEHFKISRLCVDSTGIGSFEADRMVAKHGYSKVEPFVFTLNSKEDLATSLYSAFATQSLLIPKTDKAFPAKPSQMPGWQDNSARQLREDICSLRREITSAGNVRYDAPHTAAGHADSAWSLALALHAAGQEAPRGNISGALAAMI
jgi:phage FluMu gp28-like protein